MAVDTIQELVRDYRKLLKRLEAFSGEQVKTALSDTQLSEVIARLRSAELWTTSNDQTLEAMVAGGGYDRAKAFQVLTTGSAPVQAVVDLVANGDGAEDASVVQTDDVPEPELEEPPKRRRGRPRKADKQDSE